MATVIDDADIHYSKASQSRPAVADRGPSNREKYCTSGFLTAAGCSGAMGGRKLIAAVKDERRYCMKGGRRAQIRPIGVIRSVLKRRSDTPKQGREGAPDAWLEVNPAAAEGLHLLTAGIEVIVLTWLHRARRDVLQVYPRSDRRNPLTGVFATRSPDRPNPIGLHRVTIRRIEKNRLRIGPIEAIDGTPVVDIKPVLPSSCDC
jgi:tRNA-Thr(GGU) m(6)t(6)A37 methyltransferase TsaA